MAGLNVAQLHYVTMAIKDPNCTYAEQCHVGILKLHWSCISLKIVYIDMDDVLCDFKGGYRAFREKHPHIAFPQSISGFFENLKPICSAIDSVNWLRTSDKYDVYVLTAPSTRNPLSYAEKRIWIEKHFDYEFTKNLIICAHKNLLMGDYLIDDNVVGKGQDRFSGKVIHFGSQRYPGWESVITELKGCN